MCPEEGQQNVGRDHSGTIRGENVSTKPGDGRRHDVWRVAEAHVADPDRLESVGQMLDEVENASQAHQEQIQDLADQVQSLNASYDSSEDDYASITAKGLEVARDLRAKLLDLRFSMKEQMTREEWAAVFPAPDSE